MKKSIIAAGAASVALAAMPMVGVFADSSMTDTIQVTINSACTIVNDNTTGADQGTPTTANQYNVTMKNGQLRSDIGGNTGTGDTGGGDNTITVSCNSDSGTGAGWQLQAIGKNGSSTLVSGSDTIAAGTNTTTDSSWAYKVNKTAGNTVTFTSGYDNTFNGVTTSNQLIASGTGSADFTMTYQVFIDQDQPSGTYTGGVTYTLVNPAS